MSRQRQPSINPTVVVLDDGTTLGDRARLDFSGFTISDAPASSAVSITAPTPGLQVLERNVTPVDVDNTTVETDLVSYSIPGDTFDLDGRKLVVDQRGDLFNNGLTRQITWRIYLGAVVIWEDTLSQQSISERRPFWLRTEVVRLASASQIMVAKLNIASPDNSAPTTGTAGSFGTTAGETYTMFTDGLALDERNPIAMRVSVQHSAATSNQRTRQQTWQAFTE